MFYFSSGSQAIEAKIEPAINLLLIDKILKHVVSFTIQNEDKSLEKLYSSLIDTLKSTLTIPSNNIATKVKLMEMLKEVSTL